MRKRLVYLGVVVHLHGERVRWESRKRQKVRVDLFSLEGNTRTATRARDIRSLDPCGVIPPLLALDLDRTTRDLSALQTELVRGAMLVA